MDQRRNKQSHSGESLAAPCGAGPLSLIGIIGGDVVWPLQEPMLLALKRGLWTWDISDTCCGTITWLEDFELRTIANA